MSTSDGAHFALAVRFELIAEASADFDELVEATLAEIRAKEPGTIAYLIHRSPDDSLSRIFYEAYRDRVAFEEHERQPHVRKFLAERGQYLMSEPVVWWLTPAGGVCRELLGGEADA